MFIYKITNLINNKIYVGQTIGTVQERWRKHCKKSSIGCSAVPNAITKYGKENFIVEQIDDANTIEELNEKETYWIKTLQSISPLGYNLRSGGGNSLHSQETLVKQSIAKQITVNEVKYSTMKDAVKATGLSMYKLRKLIGE